ncbi:MAG: hypothetical protein SGARI_005267 [Bacillariaceae sp.]
MSPAFSVDTRRFLPIYYGGGTWEGEVPGSVVRDYDGSSFIFPVEGYEHCNDCVTVHDDENWEVRESIVHVNRNDVDEIKRYQEKGFQEIMDHDHVEGDKIVLGRHVLALQSDNVDNFSVDLAKSMPESLRSVAEGARPKNQEKTIE